MRLKWIMLLGTAVYVSLLLFSIQAVRGLDNRPVISDVSGLMPVKVTRIVKGKEQQTLIRTLREANERNLKISIAGKRHSMGGHTYYKDAVVLDMTGYNRILDFDAAHKTVTVQSGATWDDIQQYVNPYGLAIKVMQSQNIFTVGGSLSVNAHGRDIRYGSLIDTVMSFRLLNAQGQIVEVSREQELFSLVIGGYGLFGVILDVTLELTDDELYELQTTAMNYRAYTSYFLRKVRNDPKVRMHLARISTAPDSSFLKDMYATDYLFVPAERGLPLDDYSKLKGERHTWLTRFTLGISRDFAWGKNRFWDVQKRYFLGTNGSLMTRNNVMRSESAFLEYDNAHDTDVLQEYFVPVPEFAAYIDDLRSVLAGEDLNLINITIRYVQHNEKAVLSYGKDDMFALVLLINQGLSPTSQKHTESIVRKMVDVALNHNGSFYLPYMAYPTKEQMRAAYPRADVFFSKKLQYDPAERFTNYFYEGYK
jgi:decaprenylphospho-beta-D-ribofuranose 2-oxidase